MAHLKIEDTHKVTLVRKDGVLNLALKSYKDEDNKEVVQVFIGNVAHQTYWREDFLDAIVALWPDNVAYKFDEEEVDDDIPF